MESTPITTATHQLLLGRTMERAQARTVVSDIFSGQTTPVQVASFLTALRMKGESAEEIAGMAEGMRDHAVPLPGEWSDLLDTCGTGGDRSGTFNISTTVAFVAASHGLKVAKHGNRSASSQCGSADVLEALGVQIELSPEQAAQLLEAHDVTFLFAPRYHPAMRHVGPVRRELGFPTVFNLLGPLCNPLKPHRQVLGVYKPELVDLMAGALQALGIRRALVVHGHGGLDELSLAGPSQVAEVLPDGTLRRYQADPTQYGLTPAPIAALVGGDAVTNAEIIRGVLSGEIRDARREAVVWNAAAALWIGGVASDLSEGVRLASETLDNGSALRKLESFAAATRI
ncbi:MAG TPA: anthranilate phosphoribosyltransferase [Stenomitos sp.]